MRVLTLDCELDVETDEYQFRSAVSMYDYDVVMWSPSRSLSSYTSYGSTYQGLPSLGEASSAALVRDVARRRSEFLEFIKLGRTVVVFVPGDTKVYVDTGQREYSGTGRNRHTTTIVKPFDLMGAVPATLKLIQASGLDMVPANDIVGPLYRSTSDLWAYRSIIEGADTIRPLLYIKGTTKIVAGMIREKNSGGLLLLLPELLLDYDYEDSDEYEDDEDDELEEVEEASSAPPTVSAEQQGGSSEVLVGLILLDWIASLRGEPESVTPEWAAKLRFPTEVERLEDLERLEASMSEVLGKIDVLKAAQAEDEQWKRLVFASGDALEREVQRAFSLFGFSVEDRQIGRSDLRATWNGALAVIEVKGVSKSAGERNAAQLEKWVSDEVAEGRSAKGILVVNAWRDRPIEDRTQHAFPDQMLPYSEQRGHCLVTGLQLLVMVRTCLTDPTRCEEVAQTLMEAVGPVAGWDDLGSVIADSVATSTAEASDEQFPPTVDGEVLDAEEPDPADLDLN